MSSTGTPTPLIKLNQWQSSDKPERLDFNGDNQKIDTAIRGLSTPPAQYDLPISEGLYRVAQCKYTKSKDNFVTISGRVGGNGGSAIASGIQTLATLPVGFRPLYGIHFAAAIVFSTACLAWVLPDGQLTVLSPGIAGTSNPDPAQWDGFAFSVTFLAEL